MKRIIRIVKRTLLIALGIITIACICYYKSDIGVEQLKAKYALIPSQFIEVEGLQVHYRDEGVREDSVPIVLIHGTGSSLHTWDGWVDGLKSKHRVIRFDLPAFGLTGPNKTGDYSQRYYVGFVRALLSKLKVGRCIVAGNSLGGEITWEYAMAYPDQVKKMILVDAAGYPRNPKSMPIGFKLAQTPVLKHLVKYITPYSLVESSILNVYGDKSKVTPALVQRYYDMTLREGNRQALVDRMGQFVPDSNFVRLPLLHTPTLVLWGELDMLIPVEAAEHFHRDLPDDSLVVMKGLGHVPMEEDAAGSVRVVMDFIGY
jgi:pimeloyl-ACP methyl ester carboxylesterase